MSPPVEEDKHSKLQKDTKIANPSVIIEDKNRLK